MYWNSDEHNVSDDNDGFDKETLKAANHTYNFGSGYPWLDFNVGKSGAVSIAETLNYLKKSLKHAESDCSSHVHSWYEILEFWNNIISNELKLHSE